jgi:hypothetical protein
MRRDDEVWGPVMIEEWLLHLSGPTDLSGERVAEAHQLVRDALLGLMGSLEPELTSRGISLRLMTPDT